MPPDSTRYVSFGFSPSTSTGTHSSLHTHHTLSFFSIRPDHRRKANLFLCDCYCRKSTQHNRAYQTKREPAATYPCYCFSLSSTPKDYRNNHGFCCCCCSFPHGRPVVVIYRFGLDGHHDDGCRFVVVDDDSVGCGKEAATREVSIPTINASNAGTCYRVGVRHPPRPSRLCFVIDVR